MIAEQAGAVAAAERAVQGNESDPELQVALGIAYFDAGRLDAAAAAFRRALALDESMAAAHNGIGRVCYHTGPPQAAVAAYARAIALDPHYIDPVYGLGILYSAQLGDYANAAAVFARGLAHNPGNAFLTASLGSTYARMGRFGEALAVLHAAERLDPSQAFTQSWLSIILLHLKRYDEAIFACRREIELADTHSPHRVLGYIHTARGDYAAAVGELERAIALAPEDYEARGALSQLYRMTDRPQAAAEQYAVAQELALRDDEAGQACFAAVTGDVDGALALLEVALARGQLHKGWARIDPEFACMTGDPRFHALVGA
jgi:tetratricopeptide (TPR) repeat protein